MSSGVAIQGAYAPPVRKIHNFFGMWFLSVIGLRVYNLADVPIFFNHSGGMICHDFFWLYGQSLGRAAKREWTERNATDLRTPCRKFLATPLVMSAWPVQTRRPISMLIGTGKENAPIQSAQCWFSGLGWAFPFPVPKNYKYIFQTRKQFYPTALGNCYGLYC